MTRIELAKAIIICIDNARFIGDSESKIEQIVFDLLGSVEPKDLERFAKWGQPHQQSKSDECWPTNNA